MTKWISGEPAEEVEVAWLRVEEPNGDGKCTARALLGVYDGEWWAEAGDYKGESTLDPIIGTITGWLPFEVPSV